MPDAILLAVAVHDDAKARLEPTDLEEVVCKPDGPPAFRVSYRMADSPQRREGARLEVSFRVDEGPWSRQKASMRDWPLRHDEQLGDITFQVGALEPGPHVLEYRIDFNVSDQEMGPRTPTVKTKSRLEGAVTLVQE